MLLLISKQSDAQILRDKVKTVTQTNDLFVLRDGRLFSINHTLDNSDNVSGIRRRLESLIYNLTIILYWCRFLVLWTRSMQQN